MYIQIDSNARERLEKSLNGQAGYFKLITEYEGCSTGSNYSILLISEPEATDRVIESDAFHFVIDPHQEIYFEDTLRLKGHLTFSSYRLSSDSMLYSDHVILKDRRTATSV